MKVYITRHGETEWNREGRMQGWNNSNLTEKGVENAKRLGARLKQIDFDCIYSSPLGRAIDTAKHIKGERNIDIILCEDLKEMGFGIWEGMENDKIVELYPEQKENFWSKPHLYEPVDGESYEVLIDRVEKALKDIFCNAVGENILIVTHAAVIKAIYTIIKKYPIKDFWSEPYMYDTCLSILEVRDGESNFILEADVSHLE